MQHEGNGRVNPEDYWTIDQAAEEFIVHRTTIDRAIAAGAPVERLGPRTLLPRSRFLFWVKENRPHWLAYFLRQPQE